jgi:hypothetical protein
MAVGLTTLSTQVGAVCRVVGRTGARAAVPLIVQRRVWDGCGAHHAQHTGGCSLQGGGADGGGGVSASGRAQHTCETTTGHLADACLCVPPASAILGVTGDA